MNLFEEEQFFLNIQHLGQSGNGFYTFTDGSDQHFSTTARQVNLQETDGNYQVELSHFDNSTSTFNAQLIESESADEYECFLTYDNDNQIYVLERLIAQIDLNPSRATGQDYYAILDEDIDKILDSQEEDDDDDDSEDEDEEDDEEDYEEDYEDEENKEDKEDKEDEEDEELSDVFEEILPQNIPSIEYSPHSFAHTPGYNSQSPRYQLSSESNRETPELGAHSPTPLEDSDSSEKVGYESGYRPKPLASASPIQESLDIESDSEDNDIKDLMKTISLIVDGASPAPDSPQHDYIHENNTIYDSPTLTETRSIQPQSLRSLSNNGVAEEDDSQSNSDSD